MARAGSCRGLIAYLRRDCLLCVHIKAGPKCGKGKSCMTPLRLWKATRELRLVHGSIRAFECHGRQRPGTEDGSDAIASTRSVLAPKRPGATPKTPACVSTEEVRGWQLCWPWLAPPLLIKKALMTSTIFSPLGTSTNVCWSRNQHRCYRSRAFRSWWSYG